MIDREHVARQAKLLGFSGGSVCYSPRSVSDGDLALNLLRLALRNVVENAVQYSPERSSVSIILQQTASRFEIEVIDQGPGIDPTDQDEVRERFKHGSSTTVDGSGLGLAIVDMAMNKLGGELGFRKSDKGFAVILTLPHT